MPSTGSPPNGCRAARSDSARGTSATCSRSRCRDHPAGRGASSSSTATPATLRRRGSRFGPRRTARVRLQAPRTCAARFRGGRRGTDENPALEAAFPIARGYTGGEYCTQDLTQDVAIEATSGRAHSSSATGTCGNRGRQASTATAEELEGPRTRRLSWHTVCGRGARVAGAALASPARRSRRRRGARVAGAALASPARRSRVGRSSRSRVYGGPLVRGGVRCVGDGSRSGSR
jgi:hypothetical protein